MPVSARHVWCLTILPWRWFLELHGSECSLATLLDASEGSSSLTSSRCGDPACSRGSNFDVPPLDTTLCIYIVLVCVVPNKNGTTYHNSHRVRQFIKMDDGRSNRYQWPFPLTPSTLGDGGTMYHPFSADGIRFRQDIMQLDRLPLHGPAIPTARQQPEPALRDVAAKTAPGRSRQVTLPVVTILVVVRLLTRLYTGHRIPF
jgi:hypothetical protein